MAIPRTGQLGAAALGSLSLGAPTIWTTVVPSTTHVRSAISEATPPRSSISSSGVQSTISAATAKGGVQ